MGLSRREPRSPGRELALSRSSVQTTGGSLMIQGPPGLSDVCLLLTLFSPALTVAALVPSNALASLCLRSLAHRGLPSPKPTSPWSLLPPCLHSLVRAASGLTPTPLPGTAVARQPGVRYPALLGPGGQGWRERNKRPSEGARQDTESFPHSNITFPIPQFLLGPLPSRTLESGRALFSLFAFCGQWGNESLLGGPWPWVMA